MLQTEKYTTPDGREVDFVTRLNEARKRLRIIPKTRRVQQADDVYQGDF